jgi:hypothetical protein
MPVGGLGFTHREDAFEDLQRERLIPFNLSSEGPSVAVADVDGDGLEDLFTGGAKGQAAVLLKQNPMGEFNSVSLEQFTRDRFTEDVDALFFDADGDGDQDLYLVRGGNEYAVGDPFLADRLLFNNGKGEFSNRTGAIPYTTQNGSCVTASDYDMDGDMDLFVGSRSVPGAYGISPPSFLLKNDGKGNFTDVTDLFAPVLRKAGLTSDALWADMNGDQSPDLILVGDWMNISVFINQGGRLKKWPVSNGLEQSSGWWNCIEATDLDGDGDLDLVAGNLGLNSELKASMSEPLDMYLNDFDNNGSLDQVICTFRSGRSLPIASLDELAGQIRGLKEKYPSFSDFAGLSVREIFGQDAIDRSLHLQATFLESALFLNDGKGHFETRPLPDAAQFSSVRDIMISDISGDGIKDLILVGNNYAIRPSLGRSDASYGLCLLGSDSLVFKQADLNNNGLQVVGDARRILPISINKQKSFVVPINNGELQVFKLRE